MSEKKSLVEETLLQMQDLQEALTENAKGILASTMKEEISELVKESLVEPVDGVEESETDMTEQLDVEDMEDEDEMVDDMSDEDLEDLDLLDVDDDMADNELGDEEEMDMEMDLPDELEVEDGEELLPLDLTGASDDDVLKVFKAMGEKDGIIVTQDEDEINLSDTETDSEYIIQMESEESDEIISDEDINIEEEDVIYEIELDDETTEEWNEGENLDRREDSLEEETTEEYSEEEEVKEEMSEEDTEGDETAEEYSEGEEEGEVAERSHAKLRRTVSMSEPTKRYAKNLTRESENKELKTEVQQLREKNEEYRKALNVFREKLNEVAVFNSNLAYATRLFTENSTTKKEKINILRRFDSVESLKESKSLYKTLKEELGSKEQEVVTETVNRKINSTPTKGSSTNLIENKTYENPQFQRVRDLMNKIK